MSKPYTTSWIEFPASDGWVLPGLLFEPNQKSNRVVISLHGNGSSATFYNHALNVALADSLAGAGIAFLPFNNRGAGYVQKLWRLDAEGNEEKRLFGAAYELIGECERDIDGAIECVQSLGYDEIYLLGFSTGANKVCVYNQKKPENALAGYVLACGGDDTGMWYRELGPEKFFELFNLAKENTNEGRGNQLVSDPILGSWIISSQSLHDMFNPDGEYNMFPFIEQLEDVSLATKPLFKEFSEITKPMLAVYGDSDTMAYSNPGAAIEVLKEKTQSVKSDFELVPGADHGFTDKEEELSRAIATWLTQQ